MFLETIFVESLERPTDLEAANGWWAYLGGGVGSGGRDGGGRPEGDQRPRRSDS
jgi:hypothetical protein